MVFQNVKLRNNNITRTSFLLFVEAENPFYSRITERPPKYSASDHALIPAIYVFGDSTADVGNNDYLNSKAKAVWPYGVDNNNATGRFSNGKVSVDFLATYLGLPMAPAYLSLSEDQRSQIVTGINYASASCGILNTTGMGECLCLTKQVEYFTLTATQDLPKAINDEEELSEHLGKSIFVFFIGNNDFNPQVNGNLTAKMTYEQLSDILLDEITTQMKKIYDLGARKFVVSSLSVCPPHYYNLSAGCGNRYYADKLPGRLEGLKDNGLTGFEFTVFDGYEILGRVYQHPDEFGFTHVGVPCYNHESKTLCPDRSKYNQFDRFGHQTEASHEIAAWDCFKGTSCSPYNLLELIEAD
ncbi:GDSL esterase/lipase At2g04020-like [Prosopis cineraria]|uniref:GDSL esterase/lipase At2g04020-like n=1 Tax=Prosopis cineraria TaxID=364024 RepID=UPI0024104E8D|nr:GDSL esterase/lipase At2g04020-like [Prosopis cineraria]